MIKAMFGGWLILLSAGFVYTVEAAHAYGTHAVTGAAVAFFTLMFGAGIGLLLVWADE